jgi:hypothetical protein
MLTHIIWHTESACANTHTHTLSEKKVCALRAICSSNYFFSFFTTFPSSQHFTALQLLQLYKWMSSLRSCSVSINRCKPESVSCHNKQCYVTLTVENTCAVRQALVSNISRNKWQSIIHKQHQILVTTNLLYF